MTLGWSGVVAGWRERMLGVEERGWMDGGWEAQLEGWWLTWELAVSVGKVDGGDFSGAWAGSFLFG